MQILHTTPMQDKPDDPREQPVVERAPRVVPLKLITRTPILPRSDHPKDVLVCAEKLDELLEQFGRTVLAEAVRYALNADGVNTAETTIDDLAAGEEQQ